MKAFPQLSVGVRSNVKALIWLLLFLLVPLKMFAAERVIIDLFWLKDCAYCEKEKGFLSKLKEEHPDIEIRSYEIKSHIGLAKRMTGEAGIQWKGEVPLTFIDDRHWVGFSKHNAEEIKNYIDPKIENISINEANVTLPFIGQIALEQPSMLFITFIISFVDGFNPCSLWVLTFLLGMVLHTGSRKKVVVVGATYLIITSLIYGLFVVGIFSILNYMNYISWIRVLIGCIALGMALINIKDYFWFKKGVSLTIPESQKPGIIKRTRNLLSPNHGIPGLIFMTSLLALGITIVELPCTAGFPFVWSQIVAYNKITGMPFFLLLGFYILIYLSIEIVIFISAILTLRMSKFQERHGRVLKLFGGMIMLFLGVALIVAPHVMNNINHLLALFGAAFVISVLITKSPFKAKPVSVSK